MIAPDSTTKTGPSGMRATWHTPPQSSASRSPRTRRLCRARQKRPQRVREQGVSTPISLGGVALDARTEPRAATVNTRRMQRNFRPLGQRTLQSKDARAPHTARAHHRRETPRSRMLMRLWRAIESSIAASHVVGLSGGAISTPLPRSRLRRRIGACRADRPVGSRYGTR
mgnify:CR=1 FL=1